MKQASKMSFFRPENNAWMGSGETGGTLSLNLTNRDARSRPPIRVRVRVRVRVRP